MKYIVSILFVSLLIPQFMNAQVDSKSFRFILKTILSHNVPEITVEKAAASKDQYVFLDSREPEEYNVSHLHNARFVGYKNFDIEEVKDLTKDKPLVVYCSIGKRSEDIAEKLIKYGFTNVQNLYGGIFEWVNKDHAVYDLNNKPTNNVHAYGKWWGKFLDKGNKVY